MLRAELPGRASQQSTDRSVGRHLPGTGFAQSDPLSPAVPLSAATMASRRGLAHRVDRTLCYHKSPFAMIDVSASLESSRRFFAGHNLADWAAALPAEF